MEYRILNQIKSPNDLKPLSITQLNELSSEIRDFLIHSISKTGGHLASNLGTVELTVALHKVFDSPNDKLVFDVGHQSYTHKILTGRKDRFDTLRKKAGISGFPRPYESPHDAFISGHSSTSISAAYGIAKAFQMQGKNNYAIAVIGDGAFTGGQAYEALNNAGRSKANLIVILNHNDMSISKNVGAFARYLATVRAKPGYLKLKSGVESALNHTPLVGKPIKGWLEGSKSLLKTMIYRSTFFEEMGFSYLGPTDGHDMKELLQVLNRAKELKRPVVIQVETMKGKGYSFAEENPGAYHATGKFNPSVGSGNDVVVKTYSDIMGLKLKELAKRDYRICAITAAMKYGTGLQYFYQAYKERFFDVGIAESHAVTFAGGLASQGLTPVFAVYSSFLQRGYDQIIHDLAIDCRHVVLCVDRAGVVGEDGETHQGVFDSAYLSQIPGVTVYSPEGYEELEHCLEKATLRDTGVSCVRYPRGCDKKNHTMPISDTYSYQNNNSDCLLISYGRIFTNCFQAVKQLEQEEKQVDLLKLTQIAPLDKTLVEAALSYDKIYFVEEGIKTGGIGEQFGLMLLQKGFHGSYYVRAIDDMFVPQGTVEEVLASLKMDQQGIYKMLKNSRNNQGKDSAFE